jgi:hypothetical protein
VSTKNIKKRIGGSGEQNGAGHPKTGVTKVKKCVSVTGTVWQDALKMWNGKGSDLVDRLLRRFIVDRKATI